MPTRFTLSVPAPVKPPSTSLPCASDRAHAAVSSQRCAAHGQQGQDAVKAVDNKLSAATQPWIEQTKKLKDAFAAQRTISVRDRRNQGFRSPHGGISSLKGLHYIGRSITSKVQEHTSALQLPSNVTAETVFKDVHERVLDLSELKAKVERAWRAYERALEDKPMRTKALTSCVGLTIADMIAQAAEGGGWDVFRTSKLASFGLAWHGISAHMWYQFLDKHVMADKASSTKAIVTKMVLDQTIWAPLNTALFYAYLAMADGRLSSLPDTLQAKLLPTILAGYALWPVAHLINFKYIPSSQRLLYINVVNLFWTVYLSGMANSSVAVDPVQSQVHRFGIAIPVSHSPSASPPVVQSAPAATVVQV